MYPLDGQPALEHVITRTAHADSVTDVVVATSTEPQDDVIAQYAPTLGADVIRGSEANVLSRFERAVEDCERDIFLQIKDTLSVTKALTAVIAKITKPH